MGILTKRPRAAEAKRITLLIEEFNKVQLMPNQLIVRFDEIPQVLHEYLRGFLFGMAAPIGGIYIGDYRAAIRALVMRLSEISIPSVLEEPEVVLTEWNVYMLGNYAVLFGKHADTQRVRRTSPIEAFDLQSMVAITKSGRRYLLQGCPVHREKHDQSLGGAVLCSWV